MVDRHKPHVFTIDGVEWMIRAGSLYRSEIVDHEGKTIQVFSPWNFLDRAYWRAIYFGQYRLRRIAIAKAALGDFECRSCRAQFVWNRDALPDCPNCGSSDWHATGRTIAYG